MICWKHFQTSDFETEMDPKFINMVIELGRRISLKKTAQPSQLLPLNQVDFKSKEKIAVKEKYDEVKAKINFDADGAPILQSTLLVFSNYKLIQTKVLVKVYFWSYISVIVIFVMHIQNWSRYIRVSHLSREFISY